MKDKLKGLVVGLLIGVMLTGGMTFAASTTKIEVVFDKLRYMVDGVEKKPTTGQGFIYQGTTYVPLRFAAEATGKDVSWDGKNKTIWIGKKSGVSQYLEDIEYARIDGDVYRTYFEEKRNNDRISIGGNKYEHGIGYELSTCCGKGASKGSIDYNLNGKYSKLTGFIGIDDATKNSTSIGNIIIIGDGEEIFTSPDLKGGDLPKEMNVDISGVLKLQIVFKLVDESSDHLHLTLAEAKLMK